MKGTSFQKGVELKVFIEGETWHQGGQIEGTLSPILKSSQTLPADLTLAIAPGTEKKVKTKSPDAFLLSESLPIQRNGEQFFCNLPVNAEVTDKTSSLYLIYGFPSTFAHLKLTILPHIHLQDVIDVISHHFRFPVKSVSTGIKVKFDPPASKEWTFLEQLVLHLTLQEDHIEANLEFTKKEIDALSAGLKAKTAKKNIARSWPLKGFLHEFNQRINKDLITESLEQVFQEYRSGGWLSS